MANHESSIKKSVRTKRSLCTISIMQRPCVTLYAELRNMTDKEEVTKLYPTVQKLLDKLADDQHHPITNKAANLKSGLASAHIAKLG